MGKMFQLEDERKTQACSLLHQKPVWKSWFYQAGWNLKERSWPRLSWGKKFQRQWGAQEISRHFHQMNLGECLPEGPGRFTWGLSHPSKKLLKAVQGKISSLFWVTDNSYYSLVLSDVTSCWWTLQNFCSCPYLFIKVMLPHEKLQ